MRNHSATALTLLSLTTSLIPFAAMAQSSPSAFTSAVRYDAARRVTGAIEPAPGGTSPQTYLAVRNTYDAAGQLVRVEKGALSSWQSENVAPAQWSAFAVQSQVDTAYDALGRKTIELVSSNSASYQATQYSYDSLGRLECTAVRMNPALFPGVPATGGTLSLGSLPSSACTLGAAGNDGPDRITKNAYDVAGQLLQVRKAVGTSIEEAYTTYSYTGNGKQTYVIDANGNRAQFVYDGFDRLSTWYFPSPSMPTGFDGTNQTTALNTAGSINAGDYESYQYDANGNRKQLRKRDGQVINYNYDALNRPTQKSGPTTPTVNYSYDLRGAQLAAKFASTGRGITNGFDGFGRQSSTSNDMDGTARTLTFLYDADGNRTNVTFPDGQYFAYDYDGLNRTGAIRENGGSSVVTMAWDAQGRRAGETRGVVTSSYGYDGISRISSLTDDLSGTTQDVALSFSYNAASQIKVSSRSNDGYSFTGYVNVDRGYSVNGLNQYSNVGGRTFTYDGNGNLINDGATGYVYDSENRLVSTSAAISLVYDPLGRLYQVSGGSAGTARFLYDGDQLVAEYSGNGSLLRRYVHGSGEDDPLLWYEGAGLGDRRSLQIDQQGSIVSVANAAGSANIYSYDEYGIPGVNQTGRFQYTGQAWIPEIGMYYYKARIYSPTLGRFLQTDPIGYKDQVNLYAYVANDPVSRGDPSGLAQVCVESTGSHIQSCVGVDGNGDGNSKDNDLTASQKRSFANDYRGFILNNRGRDISSFGKNVTGDGSEEELSTTRVASQFVGASFQGEGRQLWSQVSGIQIGPDRGMFGYATGFCGGASAVECMNVKTGQITVTGQRWSIFSGSSYRPSQLARILTHSMLHLKYGANPPNHAQLDTQAKQHIMNSGLGEGGCSGHLLGVPFTGC